MTGADQHAAPADVKVHHLARRSDIREAVDTNAKIVALCGMSRREVLPVDERPVCAACVLVLLGMR